MIGRQTGLELKELIKKVENPSMMTCLILNEIGEICVKGDGKTEEGEKVLVKTLNSTDMQLKAIAFSFLSVICKKSQRHCQLVSDFRNNPDNTEIVEMVDERMQELGID